MELSLSLPWVNRHRPYLALHVKHWGWALGNGKHRQIFVVMLMWGRYFNDGGKFISWYPEIPWRRSVDRTKAP
jgi:hypothetical protein